MTVIELNLSTYLVIFYINAEYVFHGSLCQQSVYPKTSSIECIAYRKSFLKCVVVSNMLHTVVNACCRITKQIKDSILTL